jgi:hypothetical protein
MVFFLWVLIITSSEVQKLQLTNWCSAVCYCNQRATQSGDFEPEFQRFKMEKLEPTIGILTNIGTAHDEGFANSQEK